MGVEVAAAVASAGGGALNAYSTYSGNLYKADVASYNASLKELEAASTLESGAVAQGQVRQESNQLIAKQQTAAAASGVTNSGSALQIMSQQAGIGEMNAQNTMQNYENRAWTLTQEANMLRDDVKQYKKAAIIGGMSSLLSSAGGTAGSFSSGGSSSGSTT